MAWTYKSEAGDKLAVTRCEQDDGHLQIVVTSAGGATAFVCVDNGSVTEAVQEIVGYGRVTLPDSAEVTALRKRVAVLESKLARATGEVAW
jgi:hypothetical protein